MDEAKGVDSTVEELTTRVLVLNFSAIHVCLRVDLLSYLMFTFLDRRLLRYDLYYNLAALTDTLNRRHFTELHSCTLLPRSKPSIRPIASRRSRDDHSRGGMVQSCSEQNAQSRQLPQGVSTQRRLFMYVSLPRTCPPLIVLPEQSVCYGKR